MKVHAMAALAIASVLLAGSASAVIVHPVHLADPVIPIGKPFAIKADLEFDCQSDIDPESPTGGTFVVDILNKDQFEWLDIINDTATFDTTACVSGQGTVFVEDIEIKLNITRIVPAFENYTVEIGIAELTSTNGTTSFQQAYRPSYTSPNSLSYDVAAQTAKATLPLNVSANGNSVFSFEIKSFTFDAQPAPEQAVAQIQPNLEVKTPLRDGFNYTTKSVDLSFTAPETLPSEDGGEPITFRWEKARVTYTVSMASKDDPSISTAPDVIVVDFINTNPDTLSKDEVIVPEDPPEEGFFKNIPGFGLVAAIVAIGAAAVVARRQD